MRQTDKQESIGASGREDDIIAFLGDAHLTARSPRFRHTLDVWDWAIEDARQRGVTAFVHLGDIAEAALEEPAREAIARRLALESTIGPVGIVLGNHEDADLLEWLDLVGQKFPILVGSKEFRSFTLEHCRVFLAPYPRRNHPPFHDLDESSIAASLSSAVERLRTAITEAVDRGGLPVILAGHFTVAGMATRDTTFELHSKTEVVVPHDALSGLLLAVLGHIHRRQMLDPVVGGRLQKIVGSGSLVRNDIGEAEDAKSYTLVRISQGETEARVDVQFIDVPARKILVRTVEWRGSTDDFLAQLSPVVVEAPGTEVKLTVSIPADHAGTFDRALVKDLESAAAMFTLDRDIESVERVRAPEIATAHTLAAQITEWLKATGQAVTDDRRAGLDEKIAQLEELIR